MFIIVDGNELITLHGCFLFVFTVYQIKEMSTDHREFTFSINRQRNSADLISFLWEISRAILFKLDGF